MLNKACAWASRAHLQLLPSREMAQHERNEVNRKHHECTRSTGDPVERVIRERILDDLPRLRERQLRNFVNQLETLLA